jgi:hypothetical protein
MNKTKIESLLNQIEASPMVTVDDSPMLHSCDVSESTGQEENHVLYINWVNGEGQDFSVKFTESGLSEAIIKDNKISLPDSDGEPSEIRLYDIQPLPIVKNY